MIDATRMFLVRAIRVYYYINITTEPIALIFRHTLPNYIDTTLQQSSKQIINPLDAYEVHVRANSFCVSIHV
jgi:hypothetical protein